MNLTVDYTKAIHPKCGKEVQTYKDIVITPFYTEEFCDELVEMSEFYKKKFSTSVHYINNYTQKFGDSPWNSLYFSRISHFLFEDFCKHYKKHICPVLEKHFYPEVINGWFSPMIIKYSKKGQGIDLHYDTSLFTLNVKLNTNYEGCLVEFPRQKWNNKDIPKGWCFIFPSKATHPHTAHPLQSGTRYVLSSWTHPVSWSPDQVGGSIYYNDRN